MKARDAISLVRKDADIPASLPEVASGIHLLEALPKLLESPTRELAVRDDDGSVRIIDANSMLEALCRQIAPRFDCSIIEVECAPADYSASRIAHAIEDADTHLVDMLSAPAEEGMLRVTLRIRCEDPSTAVLSLERYGFKVADVYGHDNMFYTADMERLLAVRTLFNV